MTKISILGCGWLGFPLAKALLENGFSVNGSTTSNEKLPVLENVGICPFLIALHENEIAGDIDSFLENSEILIIDIPPKLRGLEKENFVSKIKILIPFIENADIKKVLFISSTAVYRDDNSIISEETILEPETESGKQLLAAEQLLQSNPNFQKTILRFAGLIGAERHPIQFLSGRKNIENPNAPINLIHQIDCIGIILKIIEKEMWDESFNAAAQFHPTRKEYYTQKATELHLALPQFEEGNAAVGKTISSNRIKKMLDYEFIKPNL